MTHAYKPKWSDFAAISGGPILPLTEDQKKIPISGILPSGESGFLDDAQSRKIRNESPQSVGNGINYPYPYPNTFTEREYAYVSGDNTTKFSNEWWQTSGIIKTYPPSENINPSSISIFHYNGPSGMFSNGEQVKSNQVTNFTIFNPYIHHELIKNNDRKNIIVSIPYVSTFRAFIDWNPYKKVIKPLPPPPSGKN